MLESSAPVSTVIQHAIDRLRVGGVADSRREALRIWSDLTGDRWGTALRQGDATDSGAVVRFQLAVERRVRGEPLPYVTGTTGFRHLSLRSDYRALIPRPETEGLVELLLERVPTGAVADVGTGSGCLALSLAVEGSFSYIVGIDRSRDAIGLAQENATFLRPSIPVGLVQGDLCLPLRRAAFDALISNPPYLTVEEHAALDSSVREWEPALALVGGLDGLEVTMRLLDEGREVLRIGGWLALEIDCSRAVQTAMAAVRQGWENVSIHEDLFGRERYLLAQRSDAP
jgi:release factor glutamine methyltransferase